MKRHYLLALILLWTLSISAQLQDNDNTTNDNISEQLIFANILIDRAGDNLEQGNYEEARQLLKEASDKYKIIRDKGNMEYASGLGTLALLFLKTGNPDEALRCMIESLKITKKVEGTENMDYASALSVLAGIYSETAKYEEALRCMTETLEITKRVQGTENIRYALFLSCLAEIYLETAKYEEALQSQKEALEIRKRVQGIENMDYASALSFLAEIYFKSGNYDEAMRMGDESIVLMKKILGDNDTRYINEVRINACNISYIAIYNFINGNYQKGEEYSNRAAQLYLEIKDFDKYITTLSDMVRNLMSVNANKSVDIAWQLVKDTRVFHDSKAHADAVTALANTYGYYGNHLESATLMQDALSIYLKNINESKERILPTYWNIATDYVSMNDERFIEYSTKAIEFAKKEYGNNSLNHVKSILRLGYHYCSYGNYSKAEELIKESIIILKNFFPANEEDYLDALESLAWTYVLRHEFSSAFEICTEGAEKARNLYGKNTDSYRTWVKLLSHCSTNKKDYNKAVEYDNLVLQIDSCIEGKESPIYAGDLTKLSNDYYWLNKYDLALQHSINSISISKKFITNTLLTTSYNSVSSFWNNHQWIFDMPIIIANVMPDSPTAISAAYDNTALFSRNLLLTVDVERKKSIQESGNIEMFKAYKQLKDDIFLYEQGRTNPNSLPFDKDSLKMAILKNEEFIANSTGRIGDIIRRLNITWQDVQKALNKNDIAVEFIAVPSHENTVDYFALTLRKGDKAPKLSMLFNEEDIPQDSIYDSCKFYNMVWEPLAEEMEGVKNIYFAASGKLHQIGIEYLPNMEHYNIFRLSSTRELVFRERKNKKRKYSTIALYGGLTYNVDAETLLAENRKYIKDQVEDLNIFNSRFMSASQMIRGEREPLPETLTEVENIGKLCNIHGIQAQIYKEQYGTEESFKSLPNSNPEIIHIATHGFYYQDEEAKDLKEQLKFLRQSSTDNMYQNEEDKALTRSGLVLSGGNSVWQEDELPQELDDGILTAKEIASLDFNKLDLVVLSACQTGLGDTSNSEGVFGLQRGFKKAGAKSILMSLWEVDDKATQTFMTEFYKNLFSGKDKHESLMAAQHYLKEYANRKYASPKYWAAFILLDGLE